MPVSDTQINTTDNDDLVVGRGTVDMKGGVAVIRHALINEGKDDAANLIVDEDHVARVTKRIKEFKLTLDKIFVSKFPSFVNKILL